MAASICSILGGRGTDPHHTSPLCTHLANHCCIRPRHTRGGGGHKVQGTPGSTAVIGQVQCSEVQAGKAGSTAPGQAGNALFLPQLRRGILHSSAGWKCMSPNTVQPGTQLPTKCTECRGHKAQCPNAVWEPDQPPNYFELEAVATARVDGWMPGTAAQYPSACREQPPGQVHAGAAPLPLRTAPRSSPRSGRCQAAHLGSPQPVVVPEPCSSSLIPSSVPAGATVTSASTRPNTPPTG